MIGRQTDNRVVQLTILLQYEGFLKCICLFLNKVTNGRTNSPINRMEEESETETEGQTVVLRERKRN